jgi:hypothetical protein
VDSLFSKVPAIGGFKGGSLYTNGLGYDRFYPWVRKSEHADTLMLFINNVGVPQTLISDNAKEEVRGRARETCTKYRINIKTTVLHSPWQNLAEASIRETKKTIQHATPYWPVPYRNLGDERPPSTSKAPRLTSHHMRCSTGINQYSTTIRPSNSHMRENASVGGLSLPKNVQTTKPIQFSRLRQEYSYASQYGQSLMQNWPKRQSRPNLPPWTLSCTLLQYLL